MLVSGSIVTLIFYFIGFCWIALRNENKIKGFGYAILLWLFMAVIYDVLFSNVVWCFLKTILLDKFFFDATILNPVDFISCTDFIKAWYFRHC